MTIYLVKGYLDVAATTWADAKLLLAALDDPATEANAYAISRICGKLEALTQGDTGEPLTISSIDDTAGTYSSWVTDASTTLAIAVGDPDPNGGTLYASTLSSTISGNTRLATLALNTTALAAACNRGRMARPAPFTLQIRSTTNGVTETRCLLPLQIAAPVFEGTNPADLTPEIYITNAAARAGYVMNLATLAALKAVSVTSISTGVQALLSGYLSADDGGGGPSFTYDSASSATADDGLYVAPTAGSGRWIRNVTGTWDARWWGASSTLTTAQNAARIQAAIDAALPGQLIAVAPEILYAPDSVALKGRRLTNYARAKLANTIPVSSPNITACMTVSDGLLYVTEYGNNQVAIFSVNKASTPRLIHRFATSANPRDVRVVGRFLFVACYGAAKVEVYDVTLPTSPALVGSITTGAGPKTLEIVGNNLFVACYAVGTLEKYTIRELTGSTLTVSAAVTASCPGANQISYNPQSSIFAVTKQSDDTVYLVSAISMTPVSSAIFNSGKQFSSNKWIGDRLYVSDRSAGRVYVYNGTYGNGTLITSIAVSANPDQLFRVGNFLYVANLSDTGTTSVLNVLDITDPDVPVLVEQVTLTTQGVGFLAYQDGYIYTSAHFGTQNIDVVAVQPGAIDPYCYASITSELGALTHGYHVGPLVGAVTGNVTGNLTGAVTGNVTGNLTGNVTGTVTGNVTGNLTGDVTGNLAGDITGRLVATGSRTSVSNITTTATDFLVRSGLGATFTLHNPNSKVGQVLILYNASGSPVAVTNGFGGWSGNVPATGSVILIASLFSGTYQWDPVSTQ